MNIQKRAREWAEHKALQLNAPAVEIDMAIEVWTALAVEALTFAFEQEAVA